jgi:hypothetical protein
MPARSYPGAVASANCAGQRKGAASEGGLRVIYYWFTAGGIIMLLFIYPKNMQDNLTPDQLKQLKKVVEEEYHE